ncbi:ModD protein [Arcobacter sp. FWKO B]|nr:ModD protein [Arcobacter sp. FWKO B]
MQDLIQEDIGLFDLTTLGLEIGDKKGSMSFTSKHDCIICGIEYVKQILEYLSIEHKIYVKDGQSVKAKELLISCQSDASKLHKAWKISQNLLEYLSGISTYTYSMTKKAKEINPNIEIATTRKNFPNTKELMTKAVVCGGGTIHRLGLYDSILVFGNHLEFLKEKNELETKFISLKNKFGEKKIAVEVDDLNQANFFASLGADILQCEKMSFDELRMCVELKKLYPSLLVSATGGINLDNIEKYVKTGVDFIVTSSPYHAKPADIKVRMEALS